MGLFDSLKQSHEHKQFIKQLKVLSKRLDNQAFIREYGAVEIDVVFKKKEFHKQALEELCQLIETVPELKQIIDRYSAAVDELTDLYWKACECGANQWYGDHLVCASMLAIPETLDFLLKNKGLEDIFLVIQRIGTYLRENQKGPISE
ncbi:MAG: hypothetical protein ACI9E5_001037 [Candidatus Omnitrophota bacterium]|jgi:hypothetical protein